LGTNYLEMKLPSTTAESLRLLLGKVQAIQRELKDTTNRMEAALDSSYETDDPKAILREVRDRLKLSESALNNILSHANASLVTIGV
jgi:hypothetical protein